MSAIKTTIKTSVTPKPKNKFIKTAFVTGTMLLIISPALAEQKLKLTEQQITQFQATIAKLNLSEAQKQAATPVIKNAMQQRINIIRNAGIKKGERPSISTLFKLRGPMKEVQQSSNKQMAKILSTSQMKTYKQLVAKQREAFIARLRSKN